jgi:transposase
MRITTEKAQDERVQRVFIGIDYHKKYSTYAVINEEGKMLEQGRIDHRRPEDFQVLVKGWPEVRVVFEATSNWHWLFELMEEAIGRDRLTMANPFKTRVIAEAQVKTDKVDAAILAQLLRADLICAVHIPAKETRQRKEVLRQRCFFVRQRTRVRNRIHRLISGQHGLELPQLSDLFGVQGMSFLRKLQLPAPEGTLLQQQVALLGELQARIAEDEKLLRQMHDEHPLLGHILSLPGMGPILGAVVINEIDDISRFGSAQKFCGYAGLCPTTSSSGGKTYNGKLFKHCNKWLRWAFIEAAWIAIRVDGSLGALYQRKRAVGKRPSVAVLCVARRLARISWQLLTQKRDFATNPPAQKNQGQPARTGAPASAAGSAKGAGSLGRTAKQRAPLKAETFSPAAPLRT